MFLSPKHVEELGFLRNKLKGVQEDVYDLELESSYLKDRVKVLEKKTKMSFFRPVQGEMKETVDVDINDVVTKILEHLDLRMEYTPKTEAFITLTPITSKKGE